MSEYDLVIVGAGFGGSILANRMADAGLSVLVLEAGPELRDRQAHLNQFYRAQAKVPGSPWPQNNEEARSPSVLDIVFDDWKDGAKHYLDQNGPLPFGSTYERLGGGTGNHWQGATPRLLPNDFRLESAYGGPEGARDWPISYEELERWYVDAEHYIGVSGDHDVWRTDSCGTELRSQPFPMPPIPPSYLDQVLKRRLQGLVDDDGEDLLVRPHPQARNSIGWDGRPPCMGNSNCIPMCPIVAKYDPTVHLERAQRNSRSPAVVSYRSVAYEIEADGRHVTGVRYKVWGEGGVTEHTARGAQYVIAANAIETAKLLLMSPTFRDRSDQVGRNLMDHVIHLAWGLFDEPVHPFRGPQSTSRIGNYRDGESRTNRAAWIVGISNGGWGWPEAAPGSTVASFVRQGYSGARLRDAVADHVARQVHFTAEFEQLPSAYNRVTLSKHKDKLGLPKPAVRYQISPYTRRGFVHAEDALSRMFGAIGEEYTESHSGRPNSFHFGGRTFQTHGAGHILGTVRMGCCDQDSVVDKNLRAHCHDNLYVIGASVFPTIGTANPTLTLCALTLRAADHLAAEFKRTLPPIEIEPIREPEYPTCSS